MRARSLKVERGGKMDYVSKDKLKQRTLQENHIRTDWKYLKHTQTLLKSGYIYMFFQDFCLKFSSALSKSYSTDDFYTFDGTTKEFVEVFGYDFLMYNLDDLLSNLAKNLIIFGKAYMRRVSLYDENNCLQKVTYECLNIKKTKKRKKYLFYKTYYEDGNFIKGKIKNTEIIEFNLKELGFSKKFFIKKIRKLKKVDIILDANITFNVEKHKRTKEMFILKNLKNIYWDARNPENQYFNEPYLLYRIMMFKILQNKFLEYLISKINADISKFDKSCEINGRIKYNSTTHNYECLLEDLKTAKKNCEEILNIVF